MEKKTASKPIKLILDPPRGKVLWDPLPIWWDPIPEWSKTISPDQLSRFRELELDLQKKQIDIEKQFSKDLKNILKKSKV
jgi:hypothetical protein